MATLYELTGSFKELMEMVQDETMDQQMINDTLEGIEYEIEEKADSYAKLIKCLEGDVDAISKEIERLNNKKKTITGNISSIKKNLEKAMLVTGKTKFKTELFGFSIQKNPASVFIDQEENIPAEYWKPQKPVLDKKALGAFLKDNDVEYAHLVQTESLRIR